MRQPLLFIDRDGTLIIEPDDYQVDSVHKLKFMQHVIPSLLRLKNAGFRFIIVSNQDGLGTNSFSHSDFSIPHQLMLDIFASQGIQFDAIRICSHFLADGCVCRKPNIGLVLDYLNQQKIDREHSYVIGDRLTDMEFANNLGIQGIRIGADCSWIDIVNKILSHDRQAHATRKTNETEINISLNLDNLDQLIVDTGIGFFNHMLEQLAKHAGFGLSLKMQGDLHIDDHHTVEDTGILLGETLKKALSNKFGIGRYGFVLPMDEAKTEVLLDLSGRFYFRFSGQFSREKVGALSTELIPHFFRSFAEGLKATLHIEVKGENNHHMIESIFKSVGRTLRQAITKIDHSLPTTKGLL